LHSLRPVEARLNAAVAERMFPPVRPQERQEAIAMEFKGRCLCGAVRYRAAGPLRDVIACHCTQCRRQSGHFSAMTSVPLDRFWLDHDSALAWYRSSHSAERGFCRICGSNLFWKPATEPRISIAAGTIDGATGVKIAEHIFCANRGDYYEIADGRPQRMQS
jgi:hypothetical protein